MYEDMIYFEWNKCICKKIDAHISGSLIEYLHLDSCCDCYQGCLSRDLLPPRDMIPEFCYDLAYSDPVILNAINKVKDVRCNEFVTRADSYSCNFFSRYKMIDYSQCIRGK
jgi:hypothetical protein